MATEDFSVVLPDVQDHARVIGQPASGGGWAQALEGLADGLQLFTRTRQQAAVRKRQEFEMQRQVKADAQQQLERDAKNSFAKAALDIEQNTYQVPQAVRDSYARQSNVEKVFGPGTTVQDAYAKYGVDDQTFKDIQFAAGQWGDKLKAYDAAVTQGRIPGMGRDAQVDIAMRDLMNRYPGAESAIVDAAKAIPGFDKLSFRDSQAEAADLTNVEDSKRKADNEAYDVGVKLYGADPQLLSTLSREQIINRGRQYQYNQLQSETLNRDLETQSKQANLTTAQRDLLKTQQGEVAYGNAYTDLNQHIAPLVDGLNKLIGVAGEPGTSPVNESKLAEYVARVRSIGQARIARIVGDAAANGVSNPDALRTALQNNLESQLSLYQNTREGFTQSTKILKERFGLETDLSAPYLARLKDAGININMMPNLLDSITKADPSFNIRLSNELKNITQTSQGTSIASIELATVTSLLNGNTTLQAIPSEQAPKMVGSTANYIRSEAPKVARGQGDVDSFLNGTAVIVTAAGSIPAGANGISQAKSVARILTDGQQINAMNSAMNHPQYGEEAKVMAAGSRAAAMKALIPVNRGINSPASRQGGYLIQWDKINAQYKIVEDPKWTPPSAALFTSAKVGVPSDQSFTRGPVPRGLQELADTGNQLIYYLQKTGGWEEGSPKGTPVEVRSFWHNGQATPAMQKQLEANARRNAERGGGNFRQMTGQFEQLIQQAEQGRSEDLSAPLGGDGSDLTIVRNNNPGAIEDGAFAKSQPGYIETNGRMAKFATPQDGIRAQETLLRSSYFGKGFDTIDKIIDKYTPRHPENPENARENYKNYLAQQLGVTRTQKLDATVTSRLAAAIRNFETGKR